MLSALLTLACAHGPAPETAWLTAHAIQADARYFPDLGSPDASGYVSGFMASWFSRQLRAMEEPPLWPPARGVEAVRFTWLRSFNHPIAVRLERRDGRIGIVATELDGTGGYAPGKVLRQYVRTVSEDQARELFALLASHEVWADRAKEPAGLDGSEWMLETVDAGHYRAMTAWAPTISGATVFANACLTLLRASGLPVPSGRALY